MMRPGCSRPTLYVESIPDRGGTQLMNMPTHFSHLLRDWLPRFWACQQRLAAPDGPLFVPTMAQPLYREVVEAFAPGTRLTDELSQCAVNCTHRAPDEEYWRAYREQRNNTGQRCQSSADVVLALRGTDPRMEAARRTLPKRKGASGAGRRTIANEDATWAVVRRFAARHGLTSERARYEELPFAQQRRATCRAIIHVCQHGGAIGHTLWSSAQRPVVVQLPPWGHARAWWDGILDANGVRVLMSEGHHVVPLYNHTSTKRRRDGDESSMGAVLVDPSRLDSDLERALALSRRAPAQGGTTRTGRHR